MSKSVFLGLSLVLALIFAALFAFIVLPPMLASGDIFGALSAGFVNPYATGYSLDAIFCGLILIVWIVYERASLGIKQGWICILLTFVPGVAVGLGLYLFLRTRQLSSGQLKTGAA